MNRAKSDLDKQINQKSISAPFRNISGLIEASRTKMAYHINSEMVTVNWCIGKLINDNILKRKRAEYGKSVVLRLSHLLTGKYGSGYSVAHLTYCKSFAAIYPDQEIVHAMR
jgi:hypothetical protein